MSAADIKQALAAGATQLKLRVGEVDFQLVRIPAGEFRLGSPREEEGHQDNEEPVRQIRISKPFYLGPYEVTQAQYKSVMGSNPSRVEGDTLAVDQVTYSQAREFCRRLSKIAGVTVTLPTEAQWEYACRAGTKTRFYSGNKLEELDSAGWHKGNAGDGVHPVGQKQPNAWGLYDMHGNVWELCADLIESYEEIADTDPIGATHASYGAMRGGGWMNPPEYCRAASRLVSDDMFGGTGLRILINP